jgi:hypothetical protein
MNLVSPSGSDGLIVTGAVALGGALQLTSTSTFTVGQTVTLIDNDGTDAVTGAFANLPQGATVSAGGQLFTISYNGGTGNDVVLTRVASAPTVVSTIVNDGSAQRSRVTTLTVTFDQQVSFATTVVDAFNLTRSGGGFVTFQASASVIGGVTVVTLNNFTLSETDGYGSLNDGRYTLTALALYISAGGHQMASNYTFNDAQGLFRLFGDVNGDQTVNGLDLGFFRNAFGTQNGDPNYLRYLDLNGDGVINGFDLGQFRTRFGTVLP